MPSLLMSCRLTSSVCALHIRHPLGLSVANLCFSTSQPRSSEQASTLLRLSWLKTVSPSALCDHHNKAKLTTLAFLLTGPRLFVFSRQKAAFLNSPHSPKGNSPYTPFVSKINFSLFTVKVMASTSRFIQS